MIILKLTLRAVKAWYARVLSLPREEARRVILIMILKLRVP
jgi:hypothetical protein